MTDHGSHFQNTMMTELSINLGFKQEHSLPYYPQENEQVEVVNKSLKVMLQWMINKNRSNWHIMIYLKLWAYRTLVKDVTSFAPFQLVYGIVAILPIECEIPSMKLAIELLPKSLELEKKLIYLKQLKKIHWGIATSNDVHKRHIKVQYGITIKPRALSEGDLVLVYDQKNDTLGVGKSVSMWLNPYIIKCILGKGAYELIDSEGNTLKEPRNGLYLKRYHA